MPLTQEQEELEHSLKVETMSIGLEQARANVEQIRINVDKMRADMAAQQKQLAWETKKFVVQAIVAAAACVGAGVALANWVNNRANQPPVVQPAPTQAAPRG